MPKFKHTKGDPVFAGVSLVLKGDSVTIDFFVPTKAAGIVREAISPLMESKD